MSFEIIDFHTHPFKENKHNICNYPGTSSMSAQNTFEVMQGLGVSTICGSVVEISNTDYPNIWEKIKANNNTALELKKIYGDFYVPGFHVHPHYVEESIAEIHRMKENGVYLIGELVPYIYGWSDYSENAFSEILTEAGKCNMIVSFHSRGDDAMDKMVQNHKDVIFVAAHPGEKADFLRHIERAKMSENYYLDLSGYGMFRYGMLRKAIDNFGVDRILFGSDFPTCHPGMYIGGVLMDNLVSDSEKEKILSLNAKKLLNL